MSTGMFSIYDSKAHAFLTPFFSISAGTAIREFQAAADQADHAFNKYAADYTLFHIAEFSEDDGELNVFSAQVNLGTALSLQTKPLVRSGPTSLLPEDEAKSA